MKMSPPIFRRRPFAVRRYSDVSAKKRDSLRLNPGKYAIGLRYENREPLAEINPVAIIAAVSLADFFKGEMGQKDIASLFLEPQAHHAVAEVEQMALQDVDLAQQNSSPSAPIGLRYENREPLAEINRVVERAASSSAVFFEGETDQKDRTSPNVEPQSHHAVEEVEQMALQDVDLAQQNSSPSAPIALKRMQFEPFPRNDDTPEGRYEQYLKIPMEFSNEYAVAFFHKLMSSKPRSSSDFSTRSLVSLEKVFIKDVRLKADQNKEPRVVSASPPKEPESNSISESTELVVHRIQSWNNEPPKHLIIQNSLGQPIPFYRPAEHRIQGSLGQPNEITTPHPLRPPPSVPFPVPNFYPL